MNLKKFARLLGSILICHVAGGIGSLFMASATSDWYEQLQKPFFQPPGWIFGPVWLLLYTLMGVALYILWERSKGIKKRNQAKSLLYIFLIHLIFNAIWTPIFFGAYQIVLAFVVILIILGFVIYLVFKSWKLDKRVSYLLIPYLAWLSFATVLNFSLMVLN